MAERLRMGFERMISEATGMSVLWRWLFLLGMTLALGLGVPVAQGAPGPSLERGLNLSHWLQYGGRQPVVAADLAMIRGAGFDHVRIPVDPISLGWDPNVGANTIDWAVLDGALSLALNAGLTAILDLHPDEGLRQRVETEGPMQAAFLDLWTGLAERYADRPVAGLVFELLNEPQYYMSDGPARWADLQGRALERVRRAEAQRGAQSHRVLLSGTRGSSIEGLKLMTPVSDGNVSYVFHFYLPMLFTHLNAPWEPFQSGPQGMIANLAYPARNALNRVVLLPNANRRLAMEAVTQYLAEDWGPKRIKAEIGQAKAWAAERGMRLLCTEYGALRVGPDAPSRQRWLNDTRTALESQSIGWTLWDYADAFGIATAVGGAVGSDRVIVPRDPLAPARVFDSGALQALGLRR